MRRKGEIEETRLGAARGLLAGFLFGLAMLTVAVPSLRLKLLRNQAPARSLRSGAVLNQSFGTFNPAWTNHEVLTPKESKQTHTFFLQAEGGYGIGTNLLENSDLFNDIFPGYPERLRTDGALWSHYFRDDFSTDVYPTLLQATGHRLHRIFISTDGNLRIQRKYGGDFLVFGNSETSRGLIPEALSKAIGHLKGSESNPTLLFLTRNGASLTTISEIIDFLKPDPSQTAVLGYSVWFAFTRSSDLHLKHYHSHLSSLHIPVPYFDWDSIAGFRIQDLASTELRTHTEDTSIVQPSFIQALGKGRFEFAKEFLTEPSALARFASSVSPYYLAMDNMVPSDCNLDEARDGLQKLLTKLLKRVGKVFLYVTPTTHLHTGNAPACYVPAVHSMLASFRSKNIWIKTDSWQEYGLDFTDHALPTVQTNKYMVDPHHTNFQGATKVSKRIGSWIGAEIRNQNE